jgi:hypothetical protein
MCKLLHATRPRWANLWANLNQTRPCAFCRLRTRLFAAQCILELPSDVGSDARHFDLVAAQANPGSPAGAEKSFGAHSHAFANVGKHVAHCTSRWCDEKALS